MNKIEQWNTAFGIDDALTFTAGPGGLPNVIINNTFGRAEICLHGGHVRHWQPHGERPVLWESAASEFAVGRPIRGGIPICWPWFGPHPADAGKPAHAFARLADWEPRATRVQARGHQLVLGLRETPATLALWPHTFDLELEVTVGRHLHVSLLITNTGDQPFDYTGALHTYFAVSDVTRVTVAGLEDTDYLDTVGGARDRQRQEGPVRIAAETDRIYLNTAADCLLDDPGWGRRLRVHKQGSRTTVVWNPWIAKAKRMPDFGDEEYPGMLCIETANAEDDARTLVPGDSARLGTALSVEPLPKGDA